MLYIMSFTTLSFPFELICINCVCSYSYNLLNYYTNLFLWAKTKILKENNNTLTTNFYQLPLVSKSLHFIKTKPKRAKIKEF